MFINFSQSTAQRSLRVWLQASVSFIAFLLVLTSCDSVLSGNVPRTTELLTQPTSEEQPFVIQNSSGNTKVKSVKARFVATSLTEFTSDSVRTSTGGSVQVTGGIGVFSNDKGISLNGKQIAVYDNDGLLLPTINSTTWESRLEAHTINLDITNNTPIGDNLSANIEAFPISGSAQNQKLLNDYKIGINSIRLEISFLSVPPGGSVFSSPILFTPNWEYSTVLINNSTTNSGGGSWNRNVDKKTITYLCNRAVSTLVNGKPVAALVIGQYVISYE
jgi:hypothetical protein